jgi:hypothetical protein
LVDAQERDRIEELLRVVQLLQAVRLGFSQLGALLTNLTKHGAFIWTEKSQEAFDHMKEVMGTCPVLALPDFTMPFVLECDAFGEGIGAVLMQGGQPIVFESWKLSQPKRLYSIYDKEMLAIMHALTKFRRYLVGNKFVVKTDHNTFLLHNLDDRDILGGPVYGRFLKHYFL